MIEMTQNRCIVRLSWIHFFATVEVTEPYFFKASMLDPDF
jgi:hypothetical protein